MKKFIYILMFMVSVVWSLDSTTSAHVKITNLDGDVLYDTVMVVDSTIFNFKTMDYYVIDESGESIGFVEYFSRHLEFDYKDKSFYIEIKEKSDSEFRLSYVTPYINGKKHGVAKYYYESGQLWWETPYVNGKIHGVEKIYRESGQLWWETPFVNGKEHGIEKWYYKSGQLEWERPYVNGKRHGVRKEYNNKGEVLSTAKYKNGMLDGYKRCSDGRFGNEELECQ